MKSSIPSFSPVRIALAAAVVLASSGIAAFAQSSSSSQGSQGTTGSRRSGSTYQGSTTSQGNTAAPASGTYSTQQGSASTSGSSHMQTSDTDMQSGSTAASSQKLSWGDRRFVTKAIEDGQKELQMAQLAAQKASNPDVRRFAQQMVDQHQRVNQQLMSIAQTKNVKVEQEDEETRDYRRLSRASGNEFDREFVEHMVDEHEKDVKRYEKIAEDSKDPQLRQFATSTLPNLRQHLTQAQQLQQSVIPTGRMDEEQSGRSESTGTSTVQGSGAGWGTSSGTAGSSPSTWGSGASSSGTGAGASGSSTRTTR